MRGGRSERDAQTKQDLMLEFPWIFFFYSMLFSYREKLFFSFSSLLPPPQRCFLIF